MRPAFAVRLPPMRHTTAHAPQLLALLFLAACAKLLDGIDSIQAGRVLPLGPRLTRARRTTRTSKSCCARATMSLSSRPRAVRPRPARCAPTCISCTDKDLKPVAKLLSEVADRMQGRAVLVHVDCRSACLLRTASHGAQRQRGQEAVQEERPDAAAAAAGPLPRGQVQHRMHAAAHSQVLAPLPRRSHGRRAVVRGPRRRRRAASRPHGASMPRPDAAYVPQSFRKALGKKGGRLFVMFYAPWCGMSCRVESHL